MRYLLSILFIIVLQACGQGQESGTNLSESALNPPIIFSEQRISNPPELSTEVVQAPSQDYVPGQILLSARFGQNHPFNQHFPLIQGEHPVLGCSNTALLTLLHYYRKSLSPSGLFNTEDRMGRNEIIFFDNLKAMALLPDHIDSFSPWWQQDEIARLAYKLAAINYTEIGTKSSPGNINWGLVERYLGVRKGGSIYFTHPEFSANHQSLIQLEIQAKRPIIVSTEGDLDHMLLLDGYRFNQGVFEVHLNLGWSGRYDGWYNLSAPISVTQTINDQETTRATKYLTLYFGIGPCQGPCLQLEANDYLSVVGKKITGQLESLADDDSYSGVPLEGNVKFKVTGYEKGLYITVINHLGQIVWQQSPQQSTLTWPNAPPGQYQIRFSKRSLATSGNAAREYVWTTGATPLYYALSWITSKASTTYAYQAELDHEIRWIETPADFISGPNQEVISAPLIASDGLSLIRSFSIDFIQGRELVDYQMMPGGRLKLTPKGSEGLVKIKLIPKADPKSLAENDSQNEVVWSVLFKSAFSSPLPLAPRQDIAIAELGYTGEPHNLITQVYLKGTCSIEGTTDDDKLYADTTIVDPNNPELSFNFFRVAGSSFMVEKEGLYNVIISVPKTATYYVNGIKQHHYFASILCPELSSAENLDLPAIPQAQ